MNAAIAQIAADNTSGASEILRRAADVFSLLRAQQTGRGQESAEKARRILVETGIALVRAQPDMSPLLRLANAAISAARTATSAHEALKSAEDETLRFTAGAEQAVRAAALNAANLIHKGATILTHSRSSSVLTGLVEARRAGIDFSVVATESRPMFEGRTLAQALAMEEIRVTLIADAAASLAMDRVDLILVGADSLTPVNLLNKIGTRMISLAAHERGLPVYAVCDTSKFISADLFKHSVRNEARTSELWPDSPAGIVVVDRYFEPTPLCYFTGIITEDGVLSNVEAGLRARQVSVDKLLYELNRLRGG